MQDEVNAILDEMEETEQAVRAIEAEAQAIEQAATTIMTPAPTPLPEPAIMEPTVVVSPPAPAPKPVITIGADGKPRVGPPAQPAVKIDKVTGKPVINANAGAPVMAVSKDGKPMVKASALGGTPTAAVAAAINPSATNQATVVHPPKPKATPSGMPAALASPRGPQTPPAPGEKPDPIKKAVAETLKKKAKEKAETTPREWSSEIVRRAVAGTDVQMGGNLYSPTKKTDATQVVNTKPTPIPGKPADKRGQIISSYTTTVPKETSNKVDLIPEAVPQP